MDNRERAIDRIKILECPTGELENRLADILEEYNVAGRDEIVINRDEQSDKDGAEAYNAEISGSKEHITVLAKSGMDDYVAKVVGVYIS